jgi:hypothetical protein
MRCRRTRTRAAERVAFDGRIGWPARKQSKPGACRAVQICQASPGIEPGPVWQGLRGKLAKGQLNITVDWAKCGQSLR